MGIKAKILDEKAIGRAITRISHEIIEKNRGIEDVVIIGVKTRGVPIAKRISEKIKSIEGVEPEFKEIDITHYRDDYDQKVQKSKNRITISNRDSSAEVALDVEDKIVVLVDDVLYTGRTVRAALDYIIDYGRPKAIQLAVLVDRGHRELPIRADYVGKNVPTSREEVISVKVCEIDGEDSVNIIE